MIFVFTTLSTLSLLYIINIIISKRSKINALNSLTSTQHKNKCMILYSSMKLVCKSYYLKWLKYLNNTVKQIDKNTFEITYVINDKTYKMIVKPKRGPPPFVIEDINNNIDINKIMSHYGPNQDWHGNKLCPNFFGVSELKFNMNDGRDIVFKGDECINI